MRNVAGMALVALMLAGCAPVGAGVPAQPAEPGEDACGAAALQGLVGQPESVLETMRFAGPVRVITPGMAVTMDYNAARLNIEVDEGRVIWRVTCG